MSHVVNFLTAFAVILAGVVIAESLAKGFQAVRLIYRGYCRPSSIRRCMVRAGLVRVRDSFHWSGTKENHGLRFKLWVLVFYPLVALITFPARWWKRFRSEFFEPWPWIITAALVVIVSLGYVLYKVDWLGLVVFAIVAITVVVYVLRFVIWFLIWGIGLAVQGVRMLYRRIRPLPPPPPPVKPTVFYNTWDHVTVVFTEAAYNEAMAWHRRGVGKGYRVMNEKIIIKPCFLYYDHSVPVNPERPVKNRSLMSAPLHYFEDYIKPRCWMEERSNVHVPFTSKDRRRLALDKELFRNEEEMSHRAAMLAIFGEEIAVSLSELVKTVAPVEATA